MNEREQVLAKMLAYSEEDADNSHDMAMFELNSGEPNALSKGACEDINYIHRTYTIVGSVPSDYSVY